MSNETDHYRPVVAISACLLGQNVRYDGGHKYNQLIEKTLKPIAQITTFCPEVAAGLGTPRLPVKLVTMQTGSADIRAIGVDDRTLDVTDALLKISKTYVALFSHVDGIIFKARSPSCGLDDTVITDGNNTVLGSGIFAKIIAESCQHIALIDEQKFIIPDLREKFLTQLFEKKPSPSD
ncbi:COG1683: Uncharacterized conserved protein / FIG143828: Hypothetical protein YbgA [hydrothermal vent metagenome]|uniref:Uncharacterized protein n=1 Tax=hydrothermal vent metagenome TaxID=652676 RepID=A0A3B0YW34_9ZZZZ